MCYTIACYVWALICLIAGCALGSTICRRLDQRATRKKYHRGPPYE